MKNWQIEIMSNWNQFEKLSNSFWENYLQVKNEPIFWHLKITFKWFNQFHILQYIGTLLRKLHTK